MRKKEPSWAEIKKVVRETSLLQKENAMQLKETGKLIKELRESSKKTDRKIEEVGLQVEKTSRKVEETTRQVEETTRQVEETSRKVEETTRQMKETDRKMKDLHSNLGGISNSNGRFAEEYFYNSLERQMKFAKIHFDRISRDIKNSVKMSNGNSLEDEFDIVMFNEKSVALIEVKYKAANEYVEDLVTRKVKNFKTLFPGYEKFKIYLGLGSLSFDKKTIETAKKYGVGLLKQVGETIEYKANWDVRAY